MFTLAIIGLVMSAAATAYGIVASQQAAARQAELQEQQAKAQAASLREQAEQEEQDQLQRSMIARRQNARKLAVAESQYAPRALRLRELRLYRSRECPKKMKWMCLCKKLQADGNGSSFWRKPTIRNSSDMRARISRVQAQPPER